MIQELSIVNAPTASPTVAACDLFAHEVNQIPFPHVVNRQFIEPEIYAALRSSFPTCPPGKGPTGFSLYWGDEDYERLLESQTSWRALFQTFHSQRFIDWCCNQFAEVWEKEGCRVDLSKLRYVPYREDRIDKERATLRRIEYAPHEVWVRLDIHQGRVGYDRPIHLDHARRLMSMLIYMCDHTENEMIGGELLLYGNEPDPSQQIPATRILPRHNLMVAFPCTNRSYHSVSAITSQRHPRNYVQVHISSSVDIWPRVYPPRWRQTLGSLKRRLKVGGSR